MGMFQKVIRRTDKGAGPSGREVISLQKADSLVALETKWRAKKFLLYGTKGIRDKNFKKSNSCKVIIKALEVFPTDGLKILLRC